MTQSSNFIRLTTLWLYGGFIYFYGIERLWRGYFPHPSVFFLGGFCFILLSIINNHLPWRMGIVQQSLIGAVGITAVEFVAGIILNVWLGLNVWDYSGMVLNLLGQITLVYSIFWVFLSCVGILLDDYLRYKLFGEIKPHYTLF